MPDASSPSAAAGARAVSEAGTRMIEAAQRGVVQVGSGGRGARAGLIWTLAVSC